jgi:hypothetical protein
MLRKRKRNALRSGRVWEQGSPPPASAPSCPVIRGGREAAGPGPAGKGTGLGFCDPWRDPGSRFLGR